jgi:hypothetical protein
MYQTGYAGLSDLQHSRQQVFKCPKELLVVHFCLHTDLALLLPDGSQSPSAGSILPDKPSVRMIGGSELGPLYSLGQVNRAANG